MEIHLLYQRFPEYIPNRSQLNSFRNSQRQPIIFPMRFPHLALLKRLTFATFALASLALVGCDSTQSEHLVPASDSRFEYQGRIDESRGESRPIIWQNTRTRIAFEGDHLLLRFANVTGQPYFQIEVDGASTSFLATDGAIDCPLPLSKGKHILTLTKRSEASAGTADFLGIELPLGASAASAPAQSFSAKLLFFGDSITAGACNEDGDADQWDDRSTHNALKSYGALTGKTLGADIRNISVSGMGVAQGWSQPTFPEIWNRYGPNTDFEIATQFDYQPDILFVNLGENDDSFTKAYEKPFPENWSERYIAMVREMRDTFPDAKIVILRGGMFGGSQSERLRGPWEIVVATLKSSDANVYSYAFQHWSNLHPRVADAQKMSDELVAFIKQNKLLP